MNTEVEEVTCAEVITPAGESARERQGDMVYSGCGCGSRRGRGGRSG